jgi:hypothetical protein
MHRGEDFVIEDAEPFTEHQGAEGAVEEDWLSLVDRREGKSCLAGETQLVRGRMGAEEIVAPGRQFGAFRIHVPGLREGERFDEDSLDMMNEPCRAALQLLADGIDLFAKGRCH